LSDYSALPSFITEQFGPWRLEIAPTVWPEIGTYSIRVEVEDDNSSLAGGGQLKISDLIALEVKENPIDFCWTGKFKDLEIEVGDSEVHQMYSHSTDWRCDINTYTYLLSDGSALPSFMAYSGRNVNVGPISDL
jgi:hypothetical protein